MNRPRTITLPLLVGLAVCCGCESKETAPASATLGAIASERLDGEEQVSDDGARPPFDSLASSENASPVEPVATDDDRQGDDRQDGSAEDGDAGDAKPESSATKALSGEVVFETEETIGAIACSPDGRRLAVAYGAKLLLRDLNGEEADRTLDLRFDRVRRLVFTADGDRLFIMAGAISELTLRTWDLAADETVPVALEETNEKAKAAYDVTSDGAVFVAKMPSKLRLWSIEDGKLLPGPSLGTRTMFQDYLGGAVACGPDDGSVAWTDRELLETWQFNSSEAPASMRFGKPIQTLAYANEGAYLAVVTGHSNSTIYLCNPGTLKTVATLEGSVKTFGRLAFSSNDRLLASADGETLRLWDVAAARQIATGRGDAARGEIVDLAVLPTAPGAKRQNAVVFTAGRDGKVMRWTLNPSSGAANSSGGTAGAAEPEPLAPRLASGLATKILSTSDTKCMAYTPKGDTIAVGSKEGRVDLVDPLGKPVGSFSIEGNDLFAMAYTGDGSTLVTVQVDGTLQAWDPATGKSKWNAKAADAYPSVAAGGNLVVTCAGVIAEVWDAKTGKQLRKLQAGDNGQVAISADGKWLAIKGWHTRIRIEETRSGKSSFTLDADQSTGAIAFDAGATTLAIANWSKKDGDSVQLWDLASRKLKRELKAPHSSNWVSFSPDGKLLVYGDAFWDLPSGKLRRREVPWWDSHLRPYWSADSSRLIGLSGSSVHVLDRNLLLDDVLQGAIYDLKQRGIDIAWNGERYLIKQIDRIGQDGVDLAALRDFNAPCEVTIQYVRPLRDADLAPLDGNKFVRSLVVEAADDKLTPASAKVIGSLTNLETLRLTVADGGRLAPYLAQFTELQDLGLWNAGLTAADAETLAALKSLRRLYIDDNPIGDAGLAHLGKLPEIEELGLPGTGITSAGLVSLAKTKTLRKLWLGGNEIDDGGLAHLAGLDRLQWLLIDGIKIQADGLRHLAGLKQLEFLYLSGAKIQDADLAPLANLTGLVTLDLSHTPITGAGLKSLSTLHRLRDLVVDNADNFHGEGLSSLVDSPDLVFLRLSATPMNDDDLRHIAGLKQLKELMLPPAATDAGLVHLAQLVNLERISLTKNITGTGLAHLANCGKLTSLSLTESNSPISDEGMIAVGKLAQLKELWLPDGVSDQGVAGLQGLANLKLLSLRGPGITPASIATVSQLLALETLVFTNCGLAEDDLKPLREAMPKLKVFVYE